MSKNKTPDYVLRANANYRKKHTITKSLQLHNEKMLTSFKRCRMKLNLLTLLLKTYCVIIIILIKINNL